MTSGGGRWAGAGQMGTASVLASRYVCCTPHTEYAVLITPHTEACLSPRATVRRRLRETNGAALADTATQQTPDAPLPMDDHLAEKSVDRLRP
jgi:hypothetical protein